MATFGEKKATTAAATTVAPPMTMIILMTLEDSDYAERTTSRNYSPSNEFQQ